MSRVRIIASLLLIGLTASASSLRAAPPAPGRIDPTAVAEDARAFAQTPAATQLVRAFFDAILSGDRNALQSLTLNSFSVIALGSGCSAATAQVSRDGLIVVQGAIDPAGPRLVTSFGFGPGVGALARSHVSTTEGSSDLTELFVFKFERQGSQPFRLGSATRREL